MKAKRIIRLLGWAVTREVELDALEMECRMLTNSVRSTAEAHEQLRDEYRKCMELTIEQMRHNEEAQRKCDMERLRANKAEMERDQLADRLERAEAQVDNTREHTMQQFYQSDRSFLRWYMGRAVMEYRDRGRLPRPVVDEIKQAVSGHFLSLCKELKAWSRIVDADDDPLDIADRMEELSGSVYTRYTEMLISRLLCDGELGKGMN